MGKPLSAIAIQQLNNQDIKPVRILTVGGVDYSSYLLPAYNIDANKDFGSMSATFSLNNSSGDLEGVFSVGDIVSFKEKFSGDTQEYPRFYGRISQTPSAESYQSKTITLVCLDILSDLQGMDVDMEVEGEKILVENETLTPVYLPSPNDSLASLYNFANNSIAENPRPNIIIRDRLNGLTDPAFDGINIDYSLGQVRLGFPLNTKYNYDLVALTYFHYVSGIPAEDIIEELLTTPDAYGNYLFGEASEQAVIDNHLTETFLNVEGTTTDYLIGNVTSSTITITTTLTEDYESSDGVLVVSSTSGFPSSGQGEINGDIFTWTSKDSTHLYGIPTDSEDSNSLKNHSTDSLVKYENEYSPGKVWNLKYSNILTDLTISNFSVPSGVSIFYFDKRNGRIILDSSISLSSTITCDVDYSFKTLQASGAEINRLTFRSRELENRYDAVKKVLEYLEPNYLVRTIGDNKVWASYLYQRTVEDYSIELATTVNTTGDEDTATRVIMYKRNKNPTNIMFNGLCSFATTGQSYKSIANQLELVPVGEETNYYIYGSLFNSAVMIDTGAKTVTSYPGTCVDDSSHGTSVTNPWLNPSYSAYDDGLYAQYNFGWQETSHYLKMTNFGFTIPTEATIQGITVNIKKKAVGDGNYHTVDETVRLVVNNVIVGDNKAKTDNWSKDAPSYSCYGSTSDLWGLEEITPTEVNDSRFGVIFAAYSPDGFPGAAIDSVNITIVYDEINPDETVLTGKVNSGRIVVGTIKPIVYINDVPVDNTSHKMVAQQVILTTKTTTTTTTSSGGK